MARKSVKEESIEFAYSTLQAIRGWLFPFKNHQQVRVYAMRHEAALRELSQGDVRGAVKELTVARSALKSPALRSRLGSSLSERCVSAIDSVISKLEQAGRVGVRLSARNEAQICPYCKAGFDKGQPLAQCPRCGTLHHEECARLSPGRKCTILSCEGVLRPI